MADFAFLHGGGQGGWVWDETLAALALQAGEGTHRCLVLDVPGCGAKRGRDTGPVGFDAIVDELAGEIEAFADRDVVLVGHSQAGTVMPRLVERRPQHYRRLVYVACTAPVAGLDLLTMSAKRLHGGRDTPGGRAFTDRDMPPVERNRAMFCNDMAASQAEAFLARLGHDGWPRSSYLQRDWRYGHLDEVPSTFVLCMRDAILPPDWQDYFAKQLRCSRVVRIDAGHQVMNTRPHALAEILLGEALPGEAAG